MVSQIQETGDVTPALSLDDDDQDEDFAASDATDSDNVSSSSSDDSSSAGDEEEGGDDDAAERTGAGQALALQEELLMALHGGEEEELEEEPILSDSEYSKEFPEEKDDIKEFLEGTDEEDDDEEEDEDEAGSNAQSESTVSDGGGKAASQGYDDDEVASVMPAQSAAAATRGVSTRRAAALAAADADVTTAATEVGSPRSAPPQRRAGKQAAAEAEAPAVTPARQPLQGLLDGSSPPMDAFGALLSPLRGLEDLPIAQRTRAHISLMEVDMDALEAALAPAAAVEPLMLNLDDTAEYNRFLAGLADPEFNDWGDGGGGGGDGAGPAATLDGAGTELDSDDEDFVVELERLLEEQELGFEQAWGGGRLRGEGRRAGKQARKELPTTKEGGVVKNKKKRKSRAKPKPPRRSERLAVDTPTRQRRFARARARLGDEPGIENFAALATNIAMAPPAPVPLPSDILNPNIMLVANTVTWVRPLPKAIRRILQQPPNADAHISGADFQPGQYSQLYLVIHQHCQLLIQTVCLAVAARDREGAAAAAGMLREFGAFVTQQGGTRRSIGAPPYLSSCLGVDTGEPRGPTTAKWLPPNPGLVYTVGDVAVLRAASRFLGRLPEATLEADAEVVDAGDESEEEAAAAAAEAPPGARAAAVEGKKKRRHKPKPGKHPWETMPGYVNTALVPVRHLFDPQLEPAHPTYLTTSQMLFTPGEDELLAWGIRKYGYDWPKIIAEFLPNKTAKMMANRKKNRVQRAGAENSVKKASSLITAPLTPAEIILLTQATQYYGRQPFRWEIIVKEHLKYRHPTVLSMLWYEHLRNSTAQPPVATETEMAPEAAELQAAAAEDLREARANVRGPGVLLRGEDAAAAEAAAAAAAAAGAAAGQNNIDEQQAAEATMAWPVLPAGMSIAALRALSLPGMGAAAGMGMGTLGGGLLPPPLPPMQVPPLFQAAPGAAGDAGPSSLGLLPPPAPLQFFPPFRPPPGADEWQLFGSSGDPAAAAAAGAAAAAAERPGSGGGVTSALLFRGSSLPEPGQQQQHQHQLPSDAAAEAAPPAKRLRIESGRQQPPLGNPAAVAVAVAIASDTQAAPSAPPPSPLLSDVNGGEGSDGGKAWGSDEDKMLLRAALGSGGALSEAKLAELAASTGRSKEAVAARSAMLLERFKEKARQRRQQG